MAFLLCTSFVGKLVKVNKHRTPNLGAKGGKKWFFSTQIRICMNGNVLNLHSAMKKPLEGVAKYTAHFQKNKERNDRGLQSTWHQHLGKCGWIEINYYWKVKQLLLNLEWSTFD